MKIFICCEFSKHSVAWFSDSSGELETMSQDEYNAWVTRIQTLVLQMERLTY